MPALFPARLALHPRHLKALLFALCLAAPVLRAVEPVRIVATGGRIATFTSSVRTGDTAFRHRTPHLLGGPVAEIQIGFMDWFYPSSDAEIANTTNDVTINHAWLERASTGQVVPLTFSGSRQLVLPMNSTAPYWLSDAIPSSVWTGGPLARDEVFWLNVQGAFPEGGKCVLGTPTATTGGNFITYPGGNDPGTFDTAGAVPAITGNSGRIKFGLPVIFLGRFAEPGHLSVMGVGDSILDGTGDSNNPIPVPTGFGFLNRAAIDANGANAIAMFNLTRHAQTAASLADASRTPRQRELFKFANVVVEEYGTNDLGSGGTGVTATILSRLETIWGLARNAGVQKIVRTTLMPRTNSTDAWATPEGQTPNTGWGADGKRDTINAALQDALAAGKIDVLLDTLPVLADPDDSHRWLTDGTARYATTDGTHVSVAGNALLATALRSALLSLTVDENAPNYANWSKTVDWGSADASPEGDANGDGVTNLLSYALDLDPFAPVGSAGLPAVTVDTTTAGGPWLGLEYRVNSFAGDLVYTVSTSTDLATWTAVVIDGVDAISEIADPDPDGDGSAILRRVRLHYTTPACFLRLGVRR